METDSYNEVLMVWLSWSGGISLMCRRQCLVNQAVNPYARGILIWRWNVSSDLKIQFLINRVWWLFYVQFRFWRFSFWLIEKLIEKSRVGTRGLCISKMSVASWCWSGNVALRLEWQFRTNQRSDIARAESSKFGAVRAESDIQVGRVWSRVRYYYCYLVLGNFA